jgi:hypothetical protein
MFFYDVVYLYIISTLAQPCTVRPTPLVPSLRAEYSRFLRNMYLEALRALESLFSGTAHYCLLHQNYYPHQNPYNGMATVHACRHGTADRHQCSSSFQLWV